MMEIVVQFVSLGFGMSMILFFYGQGLRVLTEAIDEILKR